MQKNNYCGWQVKLLCSKFVSIATMFQISYIASISVTLYYSESSIYKIQMFYKLPTTQKKLYKYKHGTSKIFQVWNPLIFFPIIGFLFACILFPIQCYLLISMSINIFASTPYYQASFELIMQQVHYA